MPKNYPVAREGWPFILIFAALAAIFFAVFLPVGIAFGLLTIFTVYFFRNPERVFVGDPMAVISPADGRVVEVKENADGKKVGIFMSVFSVHVNRIPFDGVVKNIKYFPGKFLVASLDKASEHNERNAVTITTGSGCDITFVQIAGLIARRIVCYLKDGDRVKRGDRFGLIRFGSRVDVYLPASCCIKVMVGDKLQSGISIIGRFDERS